MNIIKMPLSNKEKQAAFRAKKAAANLTEVRGIYAPAEKHKFIKEAVNSMSIELNTICINAMTAMIKDKIKEGVDINLPRAEFLTACGCDDVNDSHLLRAYSIAVLGKD